MEPDMDQLCRSICTTKHTTCSRKAQKKQCSTFLERLEAVIEYDNVALEDHSCTAKSEERRRNENSWKLSSNAEGAHGPMDQRDDFKDAKEICERPYHERTAITGCGNTPIPPHQQVRQRLNQQFEGHGEYSFGLDSSVWTYYVPATMHSSIFVIAMATEQLWSTWNWDSWDSSSWSEQFFLKFQMKDISLAGNLISWQSTWERRRV